MNKSIVIFGPGHSGKSTLIGYLHSRKHPHLADKIKDEIRKSDQEYDPAQRYAYLVDTHKDERVRKRIPDLQRGNTKYMKYAKIEIVASESRETQIILIDTPGAEHTEREQFRGTFLGDAGIFVIEFAHARETLAQFLSHADRVSDFLTPLMSWVTIKPDAPFCIVLSKVDSVSSEGDAAKIHRDMCREIPKLLPGKNLVHILPTSVDVKSGKSINVLSDDPKPEWYSELSLVEVIERVLTTGDGVGASSQLMMPVARVISRPGIGNVYEGKVLSGSFSEGATVIAAPVIADRRLKLTAVKARVRAIFQGGQDFNAARAMPFARAGDIVGVTLSGASLKSFATTRSTVILSQDQAAYRGTIILVSLVAEAPEELRLLMQVTVVWLGRLLAAQIVGVCRDGTQTSYWIEAIGREEFVIPKATNDTNGGPEFAMSEVYFRGPRKKLIQARIGEVGYLSRVEIHDLGLIQKFRDDRSKMKAIGLDASYSPPDLVHLRTTLSASNAISRLLDLEEMNQKTVREQEDAIKLVIERMEL